MCMVLAVWNRICRKLKKNGKLGWFAFIHPIKKKIAIFIRVMVFVVG